MRCEQQRVWNAYCLQVSAAAYQQGNKSDSWIAKWRTMVEERQDAGEHGDPTGPIERRLERHVGVPYPQLPQAAWDTADLMSEPERTAEYDRLEQKYPGTRPGAPTTGRRARK